MLCRIKCSSCCILTSVSEFEAFIIMKFLYDNKISIKNRKKTKKCVFLENNSCLIYNIRPIICRTHGLILYDEELSTISKTCTNNFHQIEPVCFDPDYMMNITRITENLVRFNIVFCLITEKVPDNSKRVDFRDILKQIQQY